MDNWEVEYSAVHAFEQSEGIISKRYKEDEYHTIENNSISIGCINREYGYMSEDDCFLKSKSDKKYYLQKFYHYEDEYLGTPDAIEYSNYIREVNYQEIIDAFVEEETHKEKNPYSVDIHYRDEKLEHDVNIAWYEKLYNSKVWLDYCEEYDAREQFEHKQSNWYDVPLLAKAFYDYNMDKSNSDAKPVSPEDALTIIGEFYYKEWYQDFVEQCPVTDDNIDALDNAQKDMWKIYEICGKNKEQIFDFITGKRKENPFAEKKREMEKELEDLLNENSQANDEELDLTEQQAERGR